MSQVRRFEELVAWQKARVLTRQVYEMIQQGAFAKDYGLRDQIRRAAVSIMSNIAEGHERSSHADFARFLAIAKASCAEVRSQLYIALDIGYISQSKFDDMFRLADEVGRIIGGLKISVEKRKRT